MTDVDDYLTGVMADVEPQKRDKGMNRIIRNGHGVAARSEKGQSLLDEWKNASPENEQELRRVFAKHKLAGELRDIATRIKQCDYVMAVSDLIMLAEELEK